MHNLFVLMGASGSGKTELVKAVTGELPDYTSYQVSGLTRIVTCTSREPRDGERNGKEYYFITHGQFDEGGFIEQADYKGVRYGLREHDVRKAVEKGQGIILMEVQGTQQVIEWNKRERSAETAVLYMLPLPREVLQERMRTRGDTSAKIEQRLRGLEDEYKGIAMLVRKHTQSYGVANAGTIEEGAQGLRDTIFLATQT